MFGFDFKFRDGRRFTVVTLSVIDSVLLLECFCSFFAEAASPVQTVRKTLEVLYSEWPELAERKRLDEETLRRALASK